MNHIRLTLGRHKFSVVFCVSNNGSFTSFAYLFLPTAGLMVPNGSVLNFLRSRSPTTNVAIRRDVNLNLSLNTKLEPMSCLLLYRCTLPDIFSRNTRRRLDCCAFVLVCACVARFLFFADFRVLIFEFREC